MTPKKVRYEIILEYIFSEHHQAGMAEIEFDAAELKQAAETLELPCPKDLTDLVDSMKYPFDLPRTITSEQPEGKEWVFQSNEPGHYRFELRPAALYCPSPYLARKRLPDATPGIVLRHLISDEQKLLARVRHNRLLDIMTGIACHSLGTESDVSASDGDRTEISEVYVGIGENQEQHVMPVWVKDRLSQTDREKIGRDLAICKSRFPRQICRPFLAQFMSRDLIALAELTQDKLGIWLWQEKLYMLVRPKDMTADELESVCRHRLCNR